MRLAGFATETADDRESKLKLSGHFAVLDSRFLITRSCYSCPSPKLHPAPKMLNSHGRVFARRGSPRFRSWRAAMCALAFVLGFPIVSIIDRLTMMDSLHGWALLTSASQMNPVNQMLVTTPDGGHIWREPAPKTTPTLTNGPAHDKVPVQDVRLSDWVKASVSPDAGAKLAFSDDGQFLHAIGENRAIIYSANTGSTTSTLNLQPDTNVLSLTSDGRTAIIAVGNSGPRAHLLMLYTETGQLQDIPSSWYEPGPYPNAALSGDGRLISIFSEFPMTVAVYDWPTKTLVAKRTSKDISAGGIDGGGVTVDGAVELVNNRAGRKVVDLKTGRLIAWFGPDSVRSPDGAWVVEFPDLSFNESAPKEVLLKEGATGEIRGKLDVQVADDEIYGSMHGAFCGASGRFVLARGRAVALYAIPSGELLASFPAASWQDAKVDDSSSVTVACSSAGTRVAILSGDRLTFHSLR